MRIQVEQKKKQGLIMFLAPTIAVTDRQKILVEGDPRTIFLGKKILEIFFIGNGMKRREIMF